MDEPDDPYLSVYDHHWPALMVLTGGLARFLGPVGQGQGRTWNATKAISLIVHTVVCDISSQF